MAAVAVHVQVDCLGLHALQAQCEGQEGMNIGKCLDRS